MASGGLTQIRRLAAHPSSVGAARRILHDLLLGTPHESLLADGQLALSEVVTNALVHAGTEVELRVEIGVGVRVEVADGSPHLPAPRTYASLTATGRGLHLLEELVARWGVRSSGGGKTVWFELGVRSDAPSSAEGDLDGAGGSTDDDPRARDAATVVLLSVPLLLHAAWQMQAESLLREHLLSQLDEANGTDQIERHAAASEALAVLRDQLPVAAVAPDPATLLDASTDPALTADRVVVRVLPEALAQFDQLQELLQAATAMADAGVLLTPPTQPEVRSLRRWLCGEVLEQAQGRPPRRWDGGVGTEPTRAPAAWDDAAVARVTGATTAVIAADDTNRILAVSRPALALLGYDDPADLVLHRLVEIIPARFRQAHLSGFTLHLYAGRSPLVDLPVVVPALRRDGSEVSIGMTIHAEHLPRGRRVFLAHLSAVPAPDGDSETGG
ncbi:Anti-sigma regulatory factor (Ser/Thr protein kinase) [Nocardioides scoriae]|uniref:Anti-sigma regulatory factor (Ser/Thr protein kinase) n=1 Tax=Nocardioides scoriae TaxID=642780 RepID=A0A1H1R5J4_9ACTN|nr:Anti-sigma regulatory factor (Ser/Thr protein kinase) [Nocardioides scoriae]